MRSCKCLGILFLYHCHILEKVDCKNVTVSI